MFASVRCRTFYICKIATEKLSLGPHRNGRKGYSSSSVAKSGSRRHPLAVACGVLATSGIAAAYLFWPDASRSAPTYTHALLSPSHFTPVTVLANEACHDPDTRLLTLKVPSQSIPSFEEKMFKPVWSIFVKDDDIQVERPYTPLEGIGIDGCMKLWIKKYPGGEVGRWLHSKSVGDQIEVRGPIKTWQWQEDVWDEVVMISGGTGITPFYQLLHQVFLKSSPKNLKTHFTLLHSSRRPAELPPTEMLRPLLTCLEEQPEQLSVSLFVDSLEGPQHPSIASSTLSVGRIDKAAIEHALGLDRSTKIWWRAILHMGRHHEQEVQRRKKVLFLVCGPDPMIAAIAGPYGRNFSQGEVGGAIASMGYEKEQVWKL